MLSNNNMYQIWNEIQCPDCKKVQWTGGFYGQTCGNCSYEVGFGRAKERGPVSGCEHHFWTIVPRSNEDIDEHGETYKCFYCFAEIGC